MLFRKVGAEKEEGRLKEDSLSETLRVLGETAAGLGIQQFKKKRYLKSKMIHKHNNLYTKDGASVQSTEIKMVTGNT